MARLVEELEKLRRRAVFDIAGSNREHDEELAFGIFRRDLAHDAARGFGLDRAMACGARCLDKPREEELPVNVEFGYRAVGLARGFATFPFTNRSLTLNTEE